MKNFFSLVFFLLLFSCGNKQEKNEKINLKERTNHMLKLYKLIDNILHYWETWESNDTAAIVHWGIVGQRGQFKEIKSEDFRTVVQKEVDEKVADGYTEIDKSKVSFLEIEYVIDGFGTGEELDKRHRLETRMDEVLGWTGLGSCDGGSIGSGTMEVGCVVVDFEIAKKIIVEDLKNSEFSDYSRIYKLNEE